MNKQEFEMVDVFAGCANDKINELYENKQLEEVLNRLHETARQLPIRYSISFDIKVNIFDSEREAQISILNTGFNANSNEKPFRHYGDSSIQKYFVEGEISVVPHNYCPHCWGEWDFKFRHPVCPACSYELGNEVKYLLDDDICPMCQQGTVKIDKPICDACGFEVDAQKVVWG